MYAVALKLGWESFATRKGPTRLESGLVDEPRQGHRITGWETKKKKSVISAPFFFFRASNSCGPCVCIEIECELECAAPSISIHIQN